jgi:phosphoenolpyruvate carboxylase
MKRLRSVRDGTIIATPEDILLLEDTIVISINGIASGMKNSG